MLLAVLPAEVAMTPGALRWGGSERELLNLHTAVGSLNTWCVYWRVVALWLQAKFRGPCTPCAHGECCYLLLLWGKCKPSWKNNGYHCYFGLHVGQMSPIETVWFMFAWLLLRLGPPATTLDALWTRAQTAWREIPQEHIQILFDSIQRSLEPLTSMHAPY